MAKTNNGPMIVVDIEKALSLYDSQIELANALGVTRQLVWEWKRRGGPIPEGYAARLRYILKPQAFLNE